MRLGHTKKLYGILADVVNEGAHLGVVIIIGHNVGERLYLTLQVGVGVLYLLYGYTLYSLKDNGGRVVGKLKDAKYLCTCSNAVEVLFLGLLGICFQLTEYTYCGLGFHCFVHKAQ